MLNEYNCLPVQYTFVINFQTTIFKLSEIWRISDNGGPMKGATMLAKLQWLGVVASF